MVIYLIVTNYFLSFFLDIRGLACKHIPLVIVLFITIYVYAMHVDGRFYESFLRGNKAEF